MSPQLSALLEEGFNFSTYTDNRIFEIKYLYLNSFVYGIIACLKFLNNVSAVLP